MLWTTTLLVLVVAAFAVRIDLRAQRLPRRYTDAMMAIAITGSGAAALQMDRPQIAISAALGAVCYTIIPAASFAVRGGGFADIPFTVALGAAIAWKGPIAIVTAVITSSIFTALIASRSDSTTVPAGPGYLLGAVAGVLAASLW